jgi:hypothetical protein
MQDVMREEQPSWISEIVDSPCMARLLWEYVYAGRAGTFVDQWCTEAHRFTLRADAQDGAHDPRTFRAAC